MSQSASRRSLSLSKIAQITGLLFAGLTTLIVTAAPEPGIIEIRGPEGQSVAEERMPMKQFGPVQPSDTLWRIASITRPTTSISVYQMMYAFYHKNPDAFDGGNIHKLSRGAILLIPTVEEARLFSVQQASNKLKADQKLLALEDDTGAAPEPESQSKPTMVAEQQQVAGAKPSPEQPAEVSEPAKPVVDQAAVEHAERERKIYEAQMRELKNDLADSIGSIEALLAQNRNLTERVENLSGTIETLESELSKEKDQADMARRQLVAQAQSTQAEVKNLIENPPVSSLWLWGLSAGLALVFGLIGWLMLRHRKEPEIATAPLESAPHTGDLPAQEAEPETEGGFFEEEDDVLLDLGLDESEPDDELVDLSLDEPDVPDMVDLDSLVLDESDAFGEPDEVEDLLARDSDLAESETAAKVDDLLVDQDDDIPDMQEIQTLDLDLESEGGELTQEALDALAAMDDFDEAEGESQEESSMDTQEEAFDAIGQTEPIPDEDEQDGQNAPLSVDQEAEAAENELSAEIDEAVEQAVKSKPQEEELDAQVDEELDIDALLSEVQAEEKLEDLPKSDDVTGEEHSDALLTEDVVDEASIDISSLLSGEAEPEPEPELDTDPVMTAEELEQEFDLANVADELLAEAGEEDDLSSEQAEEQQTLPEQELEQQLAQLGAELDEAPDEPEEFVNIDQLLAEAENAEPEAEDLFSNDKEGLELEDEDEVSAKLDLARAYIEIGDKDVATNLLKEIIRDESGTHQREAQALLDRL